MAARALIVAALAALAAEGHTIISSPAPRENLVHTNKDLKFECGAQQGIAATYGRGTPIKLTYGRNNHHGGFVQSSVLPLSQVSGTGAEQIAQFDDPANIVHMQCYNRGCFAGGGGDKFGIGGDQKADQFQSELCSGSIIIPAYLADGDYAVKTVVYGNGDAFGVRNMPHTSYSNCHNFRVAGGMALVAKPANRLKSIQWDLTDTAIPVMNSKTGSNVAGTGHCMFNGANTHLTCRQSDKKEPLCTGSVPDLARCGQASADSRQACLGNNVETQTDGGDLFNYLIGMPSFHPDFAGSFLLLSHASNALKTVTAAGSAGGGTGYNPANLVGDGTDVSPPTTASPAPSAGGAAPPAPASQGAAGTAAAPFLVGGLGGLLAAVVVILAYNRVRRARVAAESGRTHKPSTSFAPYRRAYEMRERESLSA